MLLKNPPTRKCAAWPSRRFKNEVEMMMGHNCEEVDYWKLSGWFSNYSASAED